MNTEKDFKKKVKRFEEIFKPIKVEGFKRIRRRKHTYLKKGLNKKKYENKLRC